MNPNGSMLVYADQEAAEQKLSELRGQYIELVEKIRATAEATNSLALHRLAQVEEDRINNINF